MQGFHKRIPPDTLPRCRRSGNTERRRSRSGTRMKLYVAETMTARRASFESEVLRWAGVRADLKFGCPCYNTNDLLFAFLVTDGIVITNLDEGGREALSRDHEGTPFKPGGRAIQRWSQVPFRGADDFAAVLPFVRASYEASKEAPPGRPAKGRGRKKSKKGQARSRKRPRT